MPPFPYLTVKPEKDWRAGGRAGLALSITYHAWDFTAQDNSGPRVPGPQRNPAFVDVPSAPGSLASVFSPCLLHRAEADVGAVLGEAWVGHCSERRAHTSRFLGSALSLQRKRLASSYLHNPLFLTARGKCQLELRLP